ncbi:MULTISPECIES: GntR family transcriptional regulator [Cellulosimicrobium]|uniref:GntR family transcriptional regulator n=1 Tax=Cellulosimicrobium sp. ES-005 TaxID=3163031 RepID=A0AAU8G1C1_9MICO|nr:GntR family transcriptional regulator [Cellulosimicrobium cellulans]MCO7274890.1 GntR family transcriptional regulator [Cellulosimicrobium cellulans]
MTWTAVEPVPTTALSDHIAERLRHMIIAGEVPAGSHLAEPRLAESFDVSRGPVRDALRQLESEGLVVTRRRKVFAAGLTADDIVELYAIREAIEVLALRLAHQRADAADWAAALAALDTMRAAADDDRYDDYARADLAFHSSFYALSGSRRLFDIWRQYEPTFAVLLQITNAEDIDLGPSFASHVAILETTRAGRVEEAVAEVQEHLLGARTRMVQAHARISTPTDGELPA